MFRQRLRLNGKPKKCGLTTNIIIIPHLNLFNDNPPKKNLTLLLQLLSPLLQLPRIRHNISIRPLSLRTETRRRPRDLELRFQNIHLTQRIEPRILRSATGVLRTFALGAPVSGAVEVAVGGAEGVFAAAFGDVAVEEGDVFWFVELVESECGKRMGKVRIYRER